MSAAEQHYLALTTVAARLDVHRATVRRWVDGGRLAAVRVGPRELRIAQAELDRFLIASRLDQGGDAA
jgi:excisionase family DNA binding protein